MTAKVTLQDVERVAELAHLELSPEETPAMVKDLDAIRGTDGPIRMLGQELDMITGEWSSKRQMVEGLSRQRDAPAARRSTSRTAVPRILFSRSQAPTVIDAVGPGLSQPRVDPRVRWLESDTQ